LPLLSRLLRPHQISSGLSDGPHHWQVTAVNLAGVQAASSSATVWVDTTPPRLQITLGGRDRAHNLIRLGVRVSDVPNPHEQGAQASGLTSVRVKWGDRSGGSARRGASHRYLKAGLYRVAVTATDRAGNGVTVTHYLRILP
jgi:hypothetical protein